MSESQPLPNADNQPTRSPAVITRARVHDLLGLEADLINSLTSTPPDPAEGNQSTPFWGSAVALPPAPDYRYEDLEFHRGPFDQHGRHPMSRMNIVDAAGNEIGSWTKEGLVAPNSSRLVKVEETIYSDSGEMFQAIIGFGAQNRIATITVGDPRGDMKKVFLSYDDSGRLVRRRAYLGRIGPDGLFEKREEIDIEQPNQPEKPAGTLPAVPATPPIPVTPVSVSAPAMEQQDTTALGKVRQLLKKIIQRN